MTLTRDQLAQMIDHTLLKPEATITDVTTLCEQANELGVFSVCVSPSFLPLAADCLKEGIAVCTVAGFPSGKHHAQIKSAEAALAVAQGADEVDMVIDVGAVKAGLWRVTEREIREVRQATGGRLLKVILETAALTDDEVVRACVIAADAGADFVKTSTGFHSAGGATPRAISLMAQTVGKELGVKASGGIRTAATALELIAAGATRLGLSSTQAVLDGLSGLDGLSSEELADEVAVAPADGGY